MRMNAPVRPWELGNNAAQLTAVCWHAAMSLPKTLTDICKADMYYYKSNYRTIIQTNATWASTIT